TAFYCSNVEQYLFTGLGLEQNFYRNVATLPIDSTSTFIRSLPAPATPMAPLPSMSFTVKSLIVRTDSAGVKTITATGTDSSGKAVSSSFAAPAPVNPIGAFVSGIAPINRTLEAFLAGRLQNYNQVTALTKTDFGWKPTTP